MYYRDYILDYNDNDFSFFKLEIVTEKWEISKLHSFTYFYYILDYNEKEYFF